MSSVDSRIVTMKFDNTAFESKARTTLSTLDKLKQSMNFGNVGNAAIKGLSGIGSILGKLGLRNPFAKVTAGIGEMAGHLTGVSGVLAKFGIRNPFSRTTQGLAELQSNASHFNMSTIEGGVTGVSRSFLAMSTVAITALSQMTAAAGRAGANMAKSLTISPIKQGFDEYELKMGSIQTILSNTARYGTKLPEVMKNLNELNTYADKTIYNFGDMTKNIGLFTNAGIRVGDATAMIKGFSNEAASSGTNAQGAASAAYQLSQALSAGTVRLMDWRSLQNVGMGNKNMQHGLVELADTMGVLSKHGTSTKEVMNDFNGSLEKKWLSADVMSKYLKIMSGDIDAAKMKTMGLSDAQIKMFVQQQKNSEDAATKVRTLSQLLGTMRESVGSGWASTFELLFGDFNEATDLFTKVNNTFGNMISHSANARNALIKGWDALGGRKVLIQGIENAWNAVMKVLGAVKDGFREVFPPKTAQDIFNMTQKFTAFTKSLIPGAKTVENLKNTFAGVFAVFHIFGQVIGAVIGAIGHLFGAISGGGGGGFLAFTGGIGSAIVAFDRFLKKSGVLKTFFNGLAGILSVPIRLLRGFGTLIGGLFDGFNGSGVDKVSGSLDRFGNRVDTARSSAQAVGNFFQKLGDKLSHIGTAIGHALGQIGDVVAKAITPETFGKALDAIDTGLLAAVVLMLKKFFNGGKVEFKVNIFKGVSSTLGQVTETLKNMQASIKADIIIKIAAALALLTASILVLSTIDAKDLAKSLTALGVGFYGLQAGLVKLMTALNGFGLVKITAASIAITALAFALLQLAVALKIMSSMNIADTVQSLLTLTGVLYILVKATKPLAANSAGMVSAAAALVLLGLALIEIAAAMKLMASMNWEGIAKGLVGVAGSLLIIAGAMKLMPTGMLLQAAALVAIGFALNELGAALSIFGSLSLGEIAKGLVALAGSLLIVAGAMALMGGPMMLIQAAALVAVGVALNMLGVALKVMGSMSWEAIAKGLVTLAGSLLILAVGLAAIGASGILGAAALMASALALAVFVPVLAALGALPWGVIIKSLVSLAAIFTILGVAGILLAPMVPVILGLGAALLLLGAGIALAGAGALAFASAFGIMVAAGSAGLRMVGKLVSTFIHSIPAAMAAFGRGIVAFAKAIAAAGPAFVRSMSRIISNMLDAIIRNVPKFGRAFLVMLNTGLNVITRSIPRIASAGVRLIVGFLNAVNNHIGRITNIATSIVVKFMNSIGRNAPRLAQAGVNLVIRLMNAISSGIDRNSGRLGAAGGRLGWAIVRGIATGIASGAGTIVSSALGAAGRALSAAKAKLGIHSPSRVFRDEVGKPIAQGAALGIDDHAHLLTRSVENMGDNAMGSIKKTMDGISDALSVHGDMNPTIAPVLDLTQLTREANKMSSILATAPVMADLSYQQASSLSADTQAAQQSILDAQGPNVTEVKLEQNNYSPKALSASDIYRRTRNQLSMAKEALTTP